MERRDFLKLASLAGLSVAATGLPFMRGASAEEGAYTGPLWIMIHASGGWDPTSLCDPKGATGTMDNDPMNHYLESERRKVGNFLYAPGENVDAEGVNIYDNFFERFKNDLVVVNGIDTETNSHDTGTRVTWAGSLQEGKPSFGALLAGSFGVGMPMGYISNGGYDATAGVVAVTRTGNLDAITKVSYPDIINPNSDNKAPYHTAETTQRILEARHARHEAYYNRQHLPRIQHAMNTLYTSRLGQNELKKLTEFMKGVPEVNSGLKRQMQFALAAYQAGICVSANLSIGGFDTHGNNDTQQFNQISQILDAVNFLMTQAEEKINRKVIVLVGSDFGRTPGYNMDQGKDHWNITSMLMMGDGIKGGRVIGATDERHKALKIDPVTLQPSETGIRIKPGHIHRALRKFAGIADNEITKKFLIKEEEDLPIFG